MTHDELVQTTAQNAAIFDGEIKATTVLQSEVFELDGDTVTVAIVDTEPELRDCRPGTSPYVNRLVASATAARPSAST